METFVLSWVLMLGALTGAGNFPVDMFETTSHQFGTVVRGAKTEYEFVFTNKYMEDVIVESVQSSCQCTTPTLLTPGRIKTHQQGRIKIHVNTEQFTGNKNATITVRFAAPYRVEMQLHSYVYIRSDVSVNPGIVYFGSVDLAKTPNPGISVNVNSINYGWKILDVQSECKFLSVELKPLQSYQGTTYNMVVRLRPNAPPGPFSQVLELVTNDDVRSQRIPVRVEGRIKQTLSASPSPLSFNMVELGKKVEKTVVIQGAEPFKILDITSEDRNITASIDRTSKKVQPIKLTYTGNTTGDFNGSITILTDLEGRMDTSVHFNGKVVEPTKPVEEPVEAEEPVKTEEPEATVKEIENDTESLETPSETKGKKTEETVPEEESPNESETAESEKVEESLDLLDLPEKEEDSSKKTAALPLNFDDEEEETEKPADEKTGDAQNEELPGLGDTKEEEAEKPADEKTGDSENEELPGLGDTKEEEAGKPADEEAGDAQNEEVEKPADQNAGENASDNELPSLDSNDKEEVPENVEKADSASKPKAKIKGRNLLKKK